MTPLTPTDLVVDDEFDLRTVVAELLEAEDYAVKQAPDGLVALREVVTDSIDVILTDVGMPRLDGASFVRDLRRQGISTPVVVMSATPAELDVPSVRYLPKPFAAEHLLSTITMALTGNA